MPLRVRCRCGQELIVRYSEWVYVALALVLLAVIANTAAVIILIASFHRFPAGDGPGAAARAGEPAAGEGSPERGDAGRQSETNGQPGHEGEAGSSGAPEEESFPPAPAPSPAASSREDHGGAELGWKRSSAAVQDLLAELDLLEEPAPPPAEAADGSEPAASGSPPRPLAEVSPLLRLFLLEEAGGDLSIALACLSDPDAWLRQRALEQVLGLPAIRRGQIDEETARRCAPLLRRALDLVQEEKPRLRLLEAFAIAPSGGPADPLSEGTAERVLWSQLQSRAQMLLESLPMHRELERRLEEISRQGCDLLLAVDTTRSMERGLVYLKSTAPWLISAIEWGARGSRVGLLLYKDAVEETAAFSASPRRDVLPRILALQATGGGDVPEGVHTALRAALELGRFDWRESAIKHIVFVGDNPPAYAEKRPFESLAAASRRQGGFGIHLLGVTPAEGLAEVPFFAGFARAGGGRHATCSEETLGLEILTALLGSEARPALELLYPMLARSFGGLP
ncbi:MAG: VWA domain-containing protein [Planctomycetes bacterium]|nr:VWA domain-containing protein [Planctomycetota bacterium]